MYSLLYSVVPWSHDQEVCGAFESDFRLLFPREELVFLLSTEPKTLESNEIHRQITAKLIHSVDVAITLFDVDLGW